MLDVGYLAPTRSIQYSVNGTHYFLQNVKLYTSWSMGAGVRARRKDIHNSGTSRFVMGFSEEVF